MMGATIIVLINLGFFLGILALVGVYVYRDARERGMSAVMWTLIAILSPVLIGFIIYLLVRGSYSNLKCPKCAAAVADDYLSCPNCGAKLKATCPDCAAPVEEGWKVCPRCASSLTEHCEDISAPIKKKDQMLGKILLVIILVPVFLIGTMFLPFSVHSTSTGVTDITWFYADKYLQEIGNQQMEEWFRECDVSSGKAYVLRFDDTSDGKDHLQYLLYMPQFKAPSEVKVSGTAGLFGQILECQISDAEEGFDKAFLLLDCSRDSVPRLKIKYNGEEIEHEIIDVDYPLNPADDTAEIQ